MRIVVCVKQIFFTYARTGKDPDKYFLSPEDRISLINPYDEAALEIALRIKREHNSGEIILITLGPNIAENGLRRCLAMGADSVIQVGYGKDPDPWQKSGLLSRAIKDLNVDIVLCGKESIDSQNGQVGAFVAHKLGLPFVSAITDLAIRDTKWALVRRNAGRGIREVIECLMPAVFSVDMGVHEARMPTYEDKKKAISAEIRRLDYSDELETSKIISAGTNQPRPRAKNIPAPDSNLDSFDRIQQLLTGSRVDKKGSIIKGRPDAQAESIISFLTEHGFLRSEK